jgi:hypothetical protein
LIRAQEAGLAGATDPEIPAWAAAEQRVLLSHDVNTMIGFAVERVQRAEPMPGLVALPQAETIGLVIDALEELVRSREPGDVRGQILYLKL